jgi:hypothetical protein
MIVTPFDPNSSEAPQDSGSSAELRPLVIGDPEAEMVTLHHLSSSPPAVLRQIAPTPVGLSGKELARLRAEALQVDSPQPHNVHVSALNMSQSTPPLNAVTESGGSPYDNRRLHSEVESLRREVERLREEGFVVGGPPSYNTEEDG